MEREERERWGGTMRKEKEEWRVKERKEDVRIKGVAKSEVH
jgi:hypothetical protein